jgi:hypothetical protein
MCRVHSFRASFFEARIQLSASFLQQSISPLLFANSAALKYNDRRFSGPQARVRSDGTTWFADLRAAISSIT